MTRTNNVYLCITANSDSSFTASKWEQLDIGSPSDIISVTKTGDNLVFTKRDGTTQTLAVGTAQILPNNFDTGDLSLSGTESVTDTEAITMPAVDEEDIIESETITNFGRVYKSGRALKTMKVVAENNATLGVAWRFRYSDTAPTGTDDAKTFGTLIGQYNSNTETTFNLTDVPANRYFWFSLSGGGSRTVSKRELRISGTYGDIDFEQTGNNIFADIANNSVDMAKMDIGRITGHGQDTQSQFVKQQFGIRGRGRIDNVRQHRGCEIHRYFRHHNRNNTR